MKLRSFALASLVVAVGPSLLSASDPAPSSELRALFDAE